MEQRTASSSTSEITARILGLILLLLFCLAVFPVLPLYVISPGIDNSWRFAINLIPYTSFLFGRDVVFTAGPLGYLLYPVNVSDNIWSGIVLRMITQVLFFLVLSVYALRAGTGRAKVKLLLFLAAFLLAHFLSIHEVNYYGSFLLLLIALLADLASTAGSRSYVPMAAAAFIGASVFFMKFNVGLAALGFFVLYFPVLFFHDRQRFYGLLQTFIAVYVISLTALSLWLMGSAASAAGFFYRSWVITGSFSASASLVGDHKELLMALFAMGLYLVPLIVLKKEGSMSLPSAVGTLMFLFASFKHGFARQDAHVISFAASIALFISLAVLFSREKRSILVNTAVFIMIFVISVSLFGRYSGLDPLNFRNNMSPAGIAGKAGTIFGFRNIKPGIDNYQEQMLRDITLPENWLPVIRQKGTTVDIVPWELSYVHTYKLNWMPSPVIQLYPICDNRLDTLAASHFSSGKAPNHLVVEFMAIDGRNMILDSPATWRAISGNYSVADRDTSGRRLLLSRNNTHRPGKLKMVSAGDIDLSKPVIVPRTDKPLFLQLDMKLNLKGYINQYLFRIPPVYLAAAMEDGRTVQIRLMTDNAKNAPMISPFVEDIDSLYAFLKEKKGKRPNAVQVFGPGLDHYLKQASAAWLIEE